MRLGGNELWEKKGIVGVEGVVIGMGIDPGKKISDIGSMVLMNCG